MKMKSVILSAAVLGGLLSASSFANVNPVLNPAPAVEKIEAPVPVKIIQPVALPSRHKGSTVTLTMTIDEAGKPHHVRVMSESDQASYKSLVATVSRWQFIPGRRNGRAVPTRIELPLEVVEPNRS